jgi:hypothetical protein
MPEGFSRCESFVNFAVASTAVVDVALFNCFPSAVCMKTLSNDTQCRDLQEARSFFVLFLAQQPPVGHSRAFYLTSDQLDAETST